MSQLSSVWHAPNLRAVMTEYSSEVFPVGSKMMLRDGRVFEFALLGAVAAAVGKLYQQAAGTTNHLGLTPAAAAADAVEIDVTLGATAAAKDLYADGYAVVEDGAGAGQVFKIKGHAAIASAGTGTIKLHADTPVKTALTTASRVSLYKKRSASGAIIHPSPPTQELLGVPLYPLAADKYGWFQRKGLAAVLQDGVVTAGKLVMASDAVDGAVEPVALTEGAPNTGADALVVGTAVRNVGDTKYAIVNLELD